MRPSGCPRLFEAEALRDARLGAAERASFERHMSVCAACAREVHALEMLAEPLRASSLSDVDELHARRERVRLLAEHDRTLVAPERRPGVRRRWLALPALAALIAGLSFWRAQPLARSGAVVVHADGSAVWTRRSAADREEIVLERGALFIRVEQHTSKLVVVLPDGELEDIGTTFSVSAQDGHTTRVGVQEGSVVLRLRGQPPVAIGAGGTWSPPVETCRPNAMQAAATATESFAQPSMAVKSDPAGAFRAAIAVLEAGKPAEAAAAFARFGVKYPRDPRAEDAAYLRVIALQRLGAADGELERAAQHYLSRFPRGLRRVEVEQLSSGPRTE